MDLHSYMKDGMIENWDMFEKIMDYSYDKVRSFSFQQAFFNMIF